MMNPQRAGILRSPAVRWAAILVGLLGFIAALTILVHAALNENTIEADFYTFWMAGRSFFLEHQNPYSQDVTTQTQLGVYGRPAQGTEDHLGYAYPAYNLLPLLPFVLMDFPWASAAWLAFNLVLLVVALVAAAPKMPKLAVITLPFFYPFAFCLLLGNYPILLALAVILFYGTFIIKESRSASAQIWLGILLAWASSKPQFIWLHLAFVLLYAVRERLWKFIASFLGALAGMLLATLLWMPDWPRQWIARVIEYAGYHQHKTEMILVSLLKHIVPTSLLSPAAGLLLAICAAMAAWLFYAWWRGRLDPLVVVAWSGLFIYLIDPYGLSYAQITFWIPIILWAAMQRKLTAGFVLFWLGNLVLSWAFFGLGLALDSKAATREWPLLAYLPWLAWLLWQKLPGKALRPGPAASENLL